MSGDSIPLEISTDFLGNLQLLDRNLLAAQVATGVSPVPISESPYAEHRAPRRREARRRLKMLGYDHPKLRGAVRAFRAEARLGSGSLDGETWDALHSLISEDARLDAQRWYRDGRRSSALNRAILLRCDRLNVPCAPLARDAPDPAAVDEALVTFARRVEPPLQRRLRQAVVRLFDHEALREPDEDGPSVFANDPVTRALSAVEDELAGAEDLLDDPDGPAVFSRPVDVSFPAVEGDFEDDGPAVFSRRSVTLDDQLEGFKRQASRPEPDADQLSELIPQVSKALEDQDPSTLQHAWSRFIERPGLVWSGIRWAGRWLRSLGDWLKRRAVALVDGLRRLIGGGGRHASLVLSNAFRVLYHYGAEAFEAIRAGASRFVELMKGQVGEAGAMARVSPDQDTRVLVDPKADLATFEALRSGLSRRDRSLRVALLLLTLAVKLILALASGGTVGLIAFLRALLNSLPELRSLRAALGPA